MLLNGTALVWRHYVVGSTSVCRYDLQARAVVHSLPQLVIAEALVLAVSLLLASA